MLDAPIYRDGTVIGVVCHEHVGAPRRWTTEERDFSASVADNLSLLSEEAARAEAEDRASALQQQALELEKVKALSQLAAGTAHDVRNLVSVVRWAARSISGDTQSTPENVERADRILGATESVMAIVRDLEALGRDVAREPRVLDPVVELTRLLPLLRAAVGEHCTVSMRCAGNIGFVLVDRVQFERLVFNLVINARESMPNGGPVELELSETKIGDGDGDGEPDSHGVHVVFAVRPELARTLAAVLTRRKRALVLDARASIEIAPAVAALMASELKRDAAWVREQVEEYEALARGYLL
jgi:signal transduction histidine kinase